MPSHHLIDTALFDISFSDEETVLQAQPEFELFFKRRMMSVVDEVFDAASEAGFVIRIAKLEVDLGRVAYRDYQDELPRRLRERLKALLIEFHVTAKGGSASNNSVIEKHRVEYEQLEYFLVNGHLPWYSSLVDEVDLKELLALALRDYATRLKNFLQTTSRRQQVVVRLVSQFPLAGIEQLFHLLAPSHALLVNELLEELTIAWTNNGTIVNALGISHEDAMAQIWRFLIEAILARDSHQYSAQELLAQALRVMLFEKQKIKPKVVAAFIAQADQSAHAYLSSVNVVMQQLLQEQTGQAPQLDEKNRDEHETLQPVEANDRERIDFDDTEGLRALLIASIISGDATAIDGIWDQLLYEQGAMLEQLLRQYGQQEKIRKKLAYGFSEAQLRDILKLIEPLEHGFVTTVIEQHEWFRPTQRDRAQPRERTVRRMWEFSLAYLLVERGSRFNKKSYLGSMLRQIAVSERMDFQELMDDILENLGTYVESKQLGRQMHQLLLELKQEQGVVLKEAKTKSNRQLRAYMLYDQLNQALVDGVAAVESGQASLVQIIDELWHDYPWQLQRILRELQSGTVSWSSVPTPLPTLLLRQLVLAFIKLTSQTEAGGDTELLDAIIANAERAMNQNRYFHSLLNCLIKDEFIDFEAILARTKMTNRVSNTLADRKDTAEVGEQTNQSAGPEITDDQVEERLKLFLRGKIAITPVATASLINGIIQLLERQPQRFLQSFVLANNDKQQITRLISLLPERLLAGIVTEMAGQLSNDLQQYAELITTACHGRQLGVTPAQLRVIKWEFIFAYLTGTGRLFNAQRFIQQYVETLINLTHQQQDPQQFITLLRQQLVVNILPSTRDTSLKIVDLLSNSDVDWAGQQTGMSPLTDAPPPPQAQAQKEIEAVYIANAGIVLAAPYLPRLFEMLGLIEMSAFKDQEAKLRAVHMLQYLVNENTASPEYQLFLNKLLCGVKTDAPILRQIELTEHEKKLLNSLLQGMIENWKVLGNTSVAGLREAFLQRQGRLQLRNDAWHLRVEPRPFDMLLDQLPWRFSTIKYRWMERVIYVEWR